LCLSGTWLLGCADDAETEPLAGPCSGGTRLDDAPFVGEGEQPFGVPYNVGLDGRLLTDLSVLEPDALIVPNEHFYIRTRYPDLLDPPARWSIAVAGLVEAPSELFLDELVALERPMGTKLLECSGNARQGGFGLLSAADWDGIPLAAVFERIAVSERATRVSISGFDGHSLPSAGGHSTPGASWIFGFEELEAAGAFLATRMNGEPLPADHGAPVRLFVPGWYGCTCIKWLNELAFVDDEAPATSQMLEFASRTHQDGAPELARAYAPAVIDQAAMPIRVERWQLEGAIVHRVVGILWGGSAPTDKLQIRFGDGAWQPVTAAHTRNDTWSFWSHCFRPSRAGEYEVRLRVDDPAVRQRRLDTGYYTRVVRIEAV
jgi:DMSO/TMAO reductase YedYZ molybdopterin-dependent catalytic subunit